MRYLTSHSSLVEGWDLDPGLPNFCPCKPLASLGGGIWTCSVT